MSTKSKLTLFYSFDKASGFLPGLGAWTATRLVDVLGWVRQCHSILFMVSIHHTTHDRKRELTTAYSYETSYNSPPPHPTTELKRAELFVLCPGVL
jgi:hypothetical protein